ncbi:MAG: autotransporter-associated beta strand repeat-containing protein [Verrucomicrobia bacterium]|nr:autotransporter-associated beta strand repeat-containing protein [Verrucomicrobiota bacterium]
MIVRFNTVNVTPLDNVSGNNTLTGAITLASDVGINSVQDTLTLSGAIGDSGSGFFINKLGAGTVALSGANTYTGLTLVTAGTLQLGSGSTTGSLHTSSAISVLSGATFAVNRSNTVTQGTQFSGAAITGAGNFAQAGAGTTVLTAANSYTGTTTVSAGTLQLGSGSTTGSLSTSSAISVASGATFAVNRSNTVTQGTDFSGSAITGAGNFAQTGAGTTALTAANAYTGTTTISAGTLQLGNFGTTSTTGSLSPSSAITNNANLVFNRTDTVTQGTHFASVIAGTGTVTQAGNGTVELNGANTYAGVTTVSFAGKLNIQNSSALGTTNGGTTVAPGGKLQLQNNITVAGETLSLGTTNFGTAIQSATGGTLSSLTIGTATYELHTFTTTGTTSLNVNVATTAEYLVVAGGGAGGAASSGNSSYMPGGGGAGGMKTGTGYSLAVANYSITVGAGGSTAGANGGNSVFDTITSTGGGGGGSGNSGSFTSGVNGGSGGGGAAANGPVNNGGTGIAGQGNAGGGGAGGANYGGGGGGGAGSVGGNATGTVAGSGGSGSSSSITGSSVTYAAGGGGAIESGGTVGAGGSSGLGGTGGNQSTVATSAAANTGSGGGGQGATGSIGAGGSGIVIVRLAQVYGLSASLENVSGNNSWSGAITLTGSTVGISSLQDTLTLSGAIGDSGSGFGMTKLGAGTVALGGANTYTGATTITAGTLQLGSGSTTGSLNTSSAISVASGATFAVNRSDTVTQGTQFSGAAITGAGNFAQTGAGTTVLTAANTYTGTTTVSAGTLQFAKQVSLYNNGAAAAWSKTNINVNSGATMAFNIGGSGEFTNANIVSLLGLADATTNGFKTGAILGLDTTSGDVLFNSVIANPNGGANALGLTKLGTNKLTIDQANTYTGVTTVSNGTLKLNGAGVNTTILTDNNTATTSDIVINGGTLELAASEQIRNTGSINMTSGAFNFGAATGKIETIDKFTNSGGTFTTGANTLIGLGHTITWSGGTNTISNLGLVQDVHIVISGGTNTVQGGANGGVLELLALTQAGDGLEMSAGSTLTLNSDNAVAGKLKLSGDVSTSGNSTVTIASAPGGANPGNIDLNSGTRTFTVADGLAATDMSISARITNTGSIIKDGAGTLSLDAANNYSGTTSINNGTLIANVLGALPITPRSAVSFTGGGNPTLSLGANQVAASLNSVGATTGTVTLGSSNLTVGAASGTTDFKGSIGGAGNLIKDDASIQVISGTSNNTFTGTTTVSGGTLEVQGSLSGTTAVTVNTSGTLLLNSAASPIINTAATMTVGNSGTVKIDNSLSTTNQTFASLTLTHTPILDFGTGTSNAMTFSSLTFTATKLNVYNWSGSAYGAGVADGGNLTDGQDRLLFNADTIFIGTSDNRIEFFADNGITSLGFGQEVAFGSQFELVPITAVPEPATTALIGSIALCALIGYRERRRFTGFGKRTAARK